MNYDVIGIGNALVDIQVQVNEEMLTKLKFAKGGMTLSSDKEQEALLKSLSGIPQSFCSGGSAANTIHGISVLGGKSYYFGRVANDDYGRHYSDDMEECTVGFAGPGAEDIGTGTSVVLITPDAQRTMVTHLGASSKLNSDDVKEDIVKKAKNVYIEGYLWTSEETKKAAVKLAELAKKNSIPVAFTLSDVFIIDCFRESIMEFIDTYVDILYCNEIEGQSIAKESDSNKAFDKISALCSTLFFTCGDKGAWACRRGENKVEICGYKVNAVDTTGAGDLFAAGSLFGLAQNKSIRECTILGCYCASQVVTHLGARLPSNSNKDINKIIDSYES